MKKKAGFLWLVLLLSSCNKEQQLFKKINSDLSVQMEMRFKEKSPRMVAPDQLNGDLQFLDYAFSLLQLIDTTQLKPVQKEIWEKQQLAIASKQVELKVYRKHPEFYDMGPWLASLLDVTNDLNYKLLKIRETLDSAGQYFEYAQRNVDYFPEDRTLKAIEKQRSFVNFIGTALQDSLDNSSLTEAQKKMVTEKMEKGIMAASDYAAYCRSKLYEKEQLQ